MAKRMAKKHPFEDIPEEWRDAVAHASEEEINSRIVELAKAEAENQKAMKEDPDLAEKKEAVKFAAEGYREATKGYKLRMKFIMQSLADRAKA
jgi:hypothetical protein